MPASVEVDGVECRVERLADGSIRISHEHPQSNPMQGLGTDYPHVYQVHPCQRHQFEFWNRQLPPAERAAIEPVKESDRPWWSSASGHAGRE